MKLFARFGQAYANYYSHGRPILKSAGIAGAVGFPVFYLLQQMRTTHPYDSAILRGIATLLCLGLALRDYWPAGLRRFYLAWSYVTFLYSLPFLFILMSLKNQGGVVSVANTFLAVFFLILLTDWRNTLAMLIIGSGLATLAYIATTPVPAMPVDYLGRIPLLITVIVGGSLFKFSQEQIQAERIDAATALAGSIAHEMRNPLGQLKQSLASMQQSLPPPTMTAQAHTLSSDQIDALYAHVADGERAVKRGLQVIAMTLDEVTAKPIDTAAFSLLSAADATAKAVREYGYESNSQRDRIMVQVREDFSFRGDETAYLFVLFNLIKNALYYQPLYPDARLSITVGRHEVEVHDTGPGIAPDVLPRLFHPFGTSGKAEGTGLGLAYCHRVMRAFGGSISCESQLGEYTRFTLHFPAVTDAEESAYRDGVLEQAVAAFRGKRLLIVDDDAAQRMSTRHKLQPLAAHCDDAADGLQALQALQRERYDLILLDLNMPRLDGYAVAEKIRQGAVPANRDVRIVAYSSEPGHVASVKTHKAGMDGFVGKPCAQLPLVEALLRAMTEPSARSDQRALFSGRRILLADDSPQSRKSVAGYLRHAGADVVEAGHGQAVLDQLQGGGQWDAVLMDINMPGMSGLEAAHAIRGTRASWCKIPIVALTAHSDHRTVQAARAAGMNDFITKPVEPNVLFAKLGAMVGRPSVKSLALQPVSSATVVTIQNALLNPQRLESYRRIGMLEELLNDYVPEIARLVERLQVSTASGDLKESLDLLHSLLGMSGEAGAPSLHQAVREIYVPMLETRQWPQDNSWLNRISDLASRSEQALREYGSSVPVAVQG